jgi:hypothetical protein
MYYTPINIDQKFAKFTEQWSPKVIAAMNDYQLMLIEPAGVVNTGEAGGRHTAPNDVWI